MSSVTFFILVFNTPLLLNFDLISCRRNSWVRLFQPLLDLVGFLLTRMPRWLLGSVTPASQVLPDRSFRHLDVELLADQVAHSATSPQRLSNAQLFWKVIVDQFLD